MLSITLLGSGGGMPMPNRFLSSMLLNYQSRKILIDCGEGTQVAMRKNKCGFKSLDIICLTHCHGDHIFGLPGLLSTIGNSGRTDPITIVGPEDISDTMKSIMQVNPYLPYNIEIFEISGLSLRLTLTSRGFVINKDSSDKNGTVNLIISTLELDHSSACLGYSFCVPRRPKFYPEKAIRENIPMKYWNRLQNGEIIVRGNRTYLPSMVLGKDRKGIKLSYITDTRPIDTIPSFINKSDLFICEGTYGNEADIKKAHKNKHMTFAEAAQLASSGNVKELWITHFSPAMDKPELYINNATDIFTNTVLGQDGLRKALNYPD